MAHIEYKITEPNKRPRGICWNLYKTSKHYYVWSRKTKPHCLPLKLRKETKNDYL